jgi:hypothetical protein
MIGSRGPPVTLRKIKRKMAGEYGKPNTETRKPETMATPAAPDLTIGATRSRPKLFHLMGVIAILAVVLGLSQTPEGDLVLGVSIALIPIVVILASDVRSRASARRPVSLLLWGTFGLGFFTTLCLLIGIPDSAGFALAGLVTFLTGYLLVCYGLLWIRLATLPVAAPRRSCFRAIGTVILLIAATFTPFALACFLDVGPR